MREGYANTEEAFDTIVVGGGQAGLAAGYYLAQRGERFVILDDRLRTGKSWRGRWDSLRLFTPSQLNALPGMPFPAASFTFPSKDDAADYLEAYVEAFHLPVRHGVKVETLSRSEQGYRLTAGTASYSARNVIVATGAYQSPHSPAFAAELDPAILQLHSSAYCNPEQIPVQSVLVVGAGNSGAEIALELARAGKQVWLAGRDVGRLPVDAPIGKAFDGRLFFWVISRVLSVGTPMGRRFMAKLFDHGAPLGSVRRQEVAEAGVELTPRVSGVQSGKPQLEDGRILPAQAVVWATGYRPDFSWIDLPIFGQDGYPRHTRGVVEDAPGLYFVGLQFQTAVSSSLLGGVGADAEYVTAQIGHPAERAA